MKLTKQEAFDKVWDHFVVKASTLSLDRDNDVCRYRLDHTAGCPTRCAVGLLIPDDKYDPEIEGKMVVGLFEDHPTIVDNMEVEDMFFYQSLQGAHDCLMWKDSSIKEELEAVAKNYSLTVPVAQ